MEQQNSTTGKTYPWAGLETRVVSGGILAIITLITLMIGGWLFVALVIAAATQMIREWDTLTIGWSKKWKLAGVAYAAIPSACLIWLRDESALPVLFIVLVVCATDIGAYFAGRRIGGPKLAPAISPAKTWAGLAGGMLAAALIALISCSFTPYPATAVTAFFLGAFLAAIAQGGDLFESWIKRQADVKDSGTLIPGHGGLLDRIDGLVFAIPVYTFLLAVFGTTS
jgi:phosphatidate cytidylyltransferase